MIEYIERKCVPAFVWKARKKEAAEHYKRKYGDSTEIGFRFTSEGSCELIVYRVHN